MALDIQYGCEGADWEFVAETLEEVGMAHFAPGVHKRAFEASHTVVFVLEDGRPIGFGRAISDGAYQAAIYDCAVLPGNQGKGVGRAIVEAILAKVEGCNVTLYAAPGKEGFYEKCGFRRMKTGMARFVSREIMRERGFTD